MITLLFDAAKWAAKHKLPLLATVILFFIGSNAKSQSTSSGDVQPSWGLIDINNTLKVDTALVMSVSRATDSIASLKAMITSMGITLRDTVFTPTLNSGSRFSTTKAYVVHVYISMSIVSALAGVNSGTISFQTSPDNSTWTTKGTSPASNVGVLSTTVNTGMLSGFVPAGYYYKILTSQSGINGCTFTPLTSQANSLQ